MDAKWHLIVSVLHLMVSAVALFGYGSKAKPKE